MRRPWVVILVGIALAASLLVIVPHWFGLGSLRGQSAVVGLPGGGPGRSAQPDPAPVDPIVVATDTARHAIEDEAVPLPEPEPSQAELDARAAAAREAADMQHPERAYDFEAVVSAVGPDGHPVAGARVMLLPPPGTEDGELAVDIVLAATNEQGVAILQGRGWGNAMLTIDARPERNLQVHREVLLLAGRAIVEAHLLEGKEVSGVVIWPFWRMTAGSSRHRPAERQDAMIDLEIELALFDAEGHRSLTKVEKSGDFRFIGLGPPPYRLQPVTSELSPFIVDGIPEGATREELRIRPKPLFMEMAYGLHMGEIHGQIRGPLPLAVRAVSIEAFDRKDHLATTGIARTDERRFVLDPDGSYHLVGLRSGTYEVLFEWKDKSVTRKGPFLVTESDVVRVR